jgi:thiamine-monophosphate kinase
MSGERRGGEFELIDWIRRVGPAEPPDGVILGIGDDCAIVDLSSEGFALVTTDMLMDGRHFRLADDGAEAVGYKAMGVNISDVAAMAGVPRFAVVAVALPRAIAVETAQGLHKGLKRMADRFEVALVGGDTNAWDGPLVVSVTLLGDTSPFGAAPRSGAKPGDVVFVTGPLGGSLFRGRHLRPEPRVKEALILAEAASPSAMIDLSDGLSSDLGHILVESGGLGAELDADAIPIHPDAVDQSQADGISPLDHALHDGEDFELCLTVEPELAAKVMASPPAGVQLHRLGVIAAEPGIRLRAADGRTWAIEPKGFDHLAGGNP